MSKSKPVIILDYFKNSDKSNGDNDNIKVKCEYVWWFCITLEDGMHCRFCLLCSEHRILYRYYT